MMFLTVSMEMKYLPAFILAIVIVLMLLYFFQCPLLSIRSWLSGAYISPIYFIMMKLRKVDPAVILSAYVKCRRAELDIDLTYLEVHYLAGGDVDKVTEALVIAKSGGLALNLEKASAIDLVGRDVVETVKSAMTEIIIKCPPESSGLETVKAVCLDGYPLLVKAGIVAKIDLDKVVGGAAEQTVSARTGEAIVNYIGSQKNYRDVLNHPGSISAAVKKEEIEMGTSFKVLEVKIMNIEVGENILKDEILA